MMKLARLAAMLLVMGTAPAMAQNAAPASFAIDQVLGKADAPITIIEYASTTCSHCAALSRDTMPQVKKEWIDTGKAKLIYRDFPTAPGALSVGASMIAHCSGPVQYFPVLDMLMQNQEKWMRSDKPVDAIKSLVRIAGLDGAAVDDCLKKIDLQNAIMERAKYANTEQKVASTPTLFINGKKIEGAVPYSVLDKALKDAGK